MRSNLEHINVRIPPEDISALKRRKESEGGTVSSHIRRAVRWYAYGPPLDIASEHLVRIQDFEKVLAPVGGNLNQIARRLNMYGVEGLNESELMDAMEALRDLFLDMRMEMIEVQDELDEQLR